MHAELFQGMGDFVPQGFANLVQDSPRMPSLQRPVDLFTTPRFGGLPHCFLLTPRWLPPSGKLLHRAFLSAALRQATCPIRTLGWVGPWLFEEEEAPRADYKQLLSDACPARPFVAHVCECPRASSFLQRTSRSCQHGNCVSANG